MFIHKIQLAFLFKMILINKIFCFFSFTASQKFQCPNNKNAQYEDPEQCDKYYDCQDGVVKEKLCPDGLVFDASIRRFNKCDQPFNVDCGDRTELRKYFYVLFWNQNFITYLFY